jgi:hydrogenase nickel incorporation protein HypB
LQPAAFLQNARGCEIRHDVLEIKSGVEMAVKNIVINQDIYKESTDLAKKIHQKLLGKNIFTVNVLGGAGAGKTSVLIQIIKRIKDIKSYVIEGDIESDIDTQTLIKLGVEAYQINTGGNCHLDAPMMEAIINKLDLKNNSLLFIENIGNLVCPAEFVIGEDIKILICSVPEGSDKPYKYPVVFQKASCIILNKTDLKPYIDFNSEFFYKGIKTLNQEAPVFEVSCKTGGGFDKMVEWLTSYRH